MYLVITEYAHEPHHISEHESIEEALAMYEERVSLGQEPILAMRLEVKTNITVHGGGVTIYPGQRPEN